MTITPTHVLAELTVRTHYEDFKWSSPTKDNITWGLQIPNCTFTLHSKTGELHLRGQVANRFLEFPLSGRRHSVADRRFDQMYQPS